MISGEHAAALNIAVLVFREGLESILVLTAVTASFKGKETKFNRPVAAGVTVAFIATLLTWSIAVRVLDDTGKSLSALAVQAATGLLAILVLLLVMNWFFHKLYWTGWISLHNQRKENCSAREEKKEVSCAFCPEWPFLVSHRSIAKDLRLYYFSRVIG